MEPTSIWFIIRAVWCKKIAAVVLVLSALSVDAGKELLINFFN